MTVSALLFLPSLTSRRTTNCRTSSWQTISESIKKPRSRDPSRAGSPSKHKISLTFESGMWLLLLQAKKLTDLGRLSKAKQRHLYFTSLMDESLAYISTFFHILIQTTPGYRTLFGPKRRGLLSSLAALTLLSSKSVAITVNKGCLPAQQVLFLYNLRQVSVRPGISCSPFLTMT